MSKRHHLQIALVGGSPEPVYQGIKHLRPDQVLLLCSKKSKKDADNIKRELDKSNDRTEIVIYPIPDTGLEEMQEAAEYIESSIPKGISVSMNLTGGMKLWSLVFNNVFRRRRRSCHAFFILNGVYIDLKDKATKGKVDFDMDAQFKILGHSLDEYTSYNDYTDKDFVVLDDVLLLGLQPKYHNIFTKLTSKFYSDYKDKYGNLDLLYNQSTTQGQSFLEWNSEAQTFHCKIKDRNVFLKSPHVASIVLNTGWFELCTAKMIASTGRAKDIRLNCVFKSTNDIPKNEIDIIFNTGDKLIFVECKTQVYNSTDVDKFNSAVRNYGGLGSRPLFVTNWKMNPDPKEKCTDYGITTFYLNHPKTEIEKIEALAKVIEELNRTWNYK